LSKITVTLRKSILDPQGKAVEHGIHSLGYEPVEDVRIGKFIELSIDVPDKKEAERVTRDVCQKLLANPVMEDFSFVVEEVKQG
jgi:phosphoribosylformylglycinamidine synthase